MSKSAAASVKQLLGRVIENADIGMLFITTSGEVVLANDSFARMVGWRSRDCVGVNVLEFIHADLRENAENDWEALKSGQLESYKVERRYRRKNGTVFWVEVAISAVPGEGSEIVGFFAQYRPIDKIKRLEAEYAAAESRWNFALDSAGQGVWDVALPENVWFFSPGWKRMRGIPEDEDVSGAAQDWIKRIHPDDRVEAVELARRQAAGEVEEISQVFREKHRDGHWMWIFARGRCVERDENGRPTRLIGTDTDITAPKRHEEDVRRVSRRLELALSTSQIGIWEADLERDTIYWDEGTCAIFGRSPSAPVILGETWESYVHPDDRDKVFAAVANAVSKKIPYSLDYRIVLDTNEIRHVRCRADYYKERGGEDRFLGVNWDVTDDHRRAEELHLAYALAERRNAELEEARARMEHNALHDPLTGLPNRRYLDDLLTKLGRSRSKSGAGVTLLSIDLDRFKQINDTLGHAAGDAMLKHTGELLRDNVRKSDTVARIGGDEFVVVLSPAPTPKRLTVLVNRLIEKARMPLMFEGHLCRSGISVGIATGKQGATDTQQLLVNADIALYRAKSGGRGQFSEFTKSLQAEVIATKQCADDILSGLDRNEFMAFYQPQFDAHSLDVVGVEALVRWQHPRRGLLTPDQFLKVAEDLNAVSAIDRAVFEQSIQHFNKWRRAGLNVPHVSVNVSARRLRDKGLIDSLKDLDIQPGVFSFELLESIFLDDRDDLASWNIDQIRELGISIDVDDFGTGHASIVGLLRLNPKRLKIDRQIIEPINRSEQQRRLVRSIIEIGNSQGIEVCAEGVETLEHVRILRELGCDVLQGFFFAKPMRQSELTSFLGQQDWRAA